MNHIKRYPQPADENVRTALFKIKVGTLCVEVASYSGNQNFLVDDLARVIQDINNRFEAAPEEVLTREALRIFRRKVYLRHSAIQFNICRQTLSTGNMGAEKWS